MSKREKFTEMANALEPCPDCGSMKHKTCDAIDVASRLPKVESKRHDEVTADDEPEIFALLNLHRANVEASSSPEAKQVFLDTMGFLLELAKVRHAAKSTPPGTRTRW